MAIISPRKVSSTNFLVHDLWLLLDIKHILGAKFHEYLKKHASGELNPYNSLPEKLQSIYIQLIRVAALRVPLDLERQVNPKMWGIPSAISTAPLAELIQLLNVYIERSYYNRAALSLPKDDDDNDDEYVVEDDDQGQDKDGDTDDNASMSDAEHNNAVTWFISFPQVVLDEIASTIQHPYLPFWRCYYEVCSLLPYY